MTTSPEKTLRAAATKARSLADRATGNQDPWRASDSLPSPSVRTARGHEVAYGTRWQDMEFIAAMHPGVARAVADLLDQFADRWRDEVRYDRLHDTCDGDVNEDCSCFDTALAVARALLGGEA